MKSTTPNQPLPMIFTAEEGFSTPQLHACAGLIATDRAAREAILHRAYSIWENAGRPENRDLAHWLEAEAGVLAGT